MTDASLRLRCAVPALWALILSTVAAAGPGGGLGRKTQQHDGDPKCASELTVIAPDGKSHAYPSPEDFLKAMDVVEIDQGERPRPAVKLENVLANLHASSVDALDCANQSQSLPVGLPVEGPIYLVLTGRGTLKFVRESQPGSFVNLVKGVQRLTFHAPLPDKVQKSEAKRSPK